MFRISLVIFLLISFSAFTQPTKVNYSELDYEIFDIRLKETVLYQSADFYVTQDNNVLVPLDLVINLLEINLNFDPQSVSFSGSLASEDLNISLDNLDQNIAGNIYWTQDDTGYYFDLRVIAELIKANISIDYSSLYFNIQPRNLALKYPIEVRLERESRQVTDIASGAVNYKFIIEDQYRALTPPKGQVSLNVFHDDSTESTDVTGNVNLYGDVLYHATTLNISDSSATGADTTGRLKFERFQSAPSKKIFGVLDRYAFGDVSNTRTRFGTPISGLGLSLSTVDKRFDNYYGKATIDEDVPANWQVELYKYGYLIAISTATDEGRVIFDELDVNYGTNRFELKLYGPFGETESRFVDIIVGNQIVKQGQVDYTLNIVDENKSIFDNGSNNSGSYNPTINLQTDIGLGNKTSLGIGYLTKDRVDTNLSDDEKEEQVAISLSKSFSNSLLNFNGITNQDDEQTYNINLFGSLGKFSRYQISFENNDTELNKGNSFNSYYFTRFQRWSFAVNSNFAKRELVDQTFDIQNHRLQISSNLFGANLSNAFNYTNNNDLESWTGQLSLSKAITPLITSRFSLDYIIQNEQESDFALQSANLNTNWRTNTRLNGSFDIRYNSDDSYEIRNQLAWRTSKVNLTSQVRYSSETKWQVGIGVTFNLDYDYYNNTLNLQSEYSARSATLDVFSYLDRNKSGDFDEFDSPVEGVRFGPAPYWSDLKSNKKGYTYLVSPNVGRPSRLSYDTSETQSDILSPVYSNLRFYTHPGGVNTLDVPFNYSSFLDGTIINQSNKLISNSIPMELVAKSGKVLQRFNSYQSNAYSLEKLWPGNYQIRISPSYLKQLGLVSIPASRSIDVKPDTNFVEVEEFELITEEEAASSTKTQMFDNDFFTIQFGAYNDEEYCALRAKQLRESGYEDAFYSMATNSCKVYIGQYTTEEAAESFKSTMEQSLVQDGFTTLFRTGEDIFSIQIDSYSIQLSAMSGNQECSTELFADWLAKEPNLYILDTGGYCKLYLGDFLSRKAASEALKALPKTLNKGAFIVKR